MKNFIFSVSYYRFCLKMHEFPADGFLVTNIKSDKYELCDTDLCNRKDVNSFNFKL